MEKQNQKKKKEDFRIKNKELKKEKESSSEKEEERNGIIPEGMDFKKFMGCGGWFLQLLEFKVHP